MSKICVFCSSVIEDDAAFCDVCGKSIGNDVAEKSDEKVFDENVVDGTASEPAAEETAAEETVAEETVAEETAVEEPAAEEASQEVAAEQPAEEKPLPFMPEIRGEEADVSEETPEKETSGKKPAETETKRRKKEKVIRPLTAGGVISAIFLAIIIVLNVALIFGCALGYGAAKSDIYNYRFDMGNGHTFSLSDIKNSDPTVAESTSDIVKGVFDVLEHFNYDAGEQTFSLDFSDDSRFLVEAAMENSHQFEQIIRNAVNTLSTVFACFMIGLGCYILLVTVIFTVTLVISLARRRSALIIPGVILMVMGIAGMSFVLLASFTSGVIGIAAVTQLFSIDSVVMSTLITTAFSSVAGTLLTVIGTTGKKN